MPRKYAELGLGLILASATALLIHDQSWPQGMTLGAIIAAALLPQAANLLRRQDDPAEHMRAFTQRLIDIIPEPVYIKDRHSRYLMVNEAFARERGREKQELIGLSSYDLAPSPESGALAAREDLAVIAGAEIQKEQHTTLARTGEECFRIVSKRGGTYFDGSPIVVGSHFYITRWKIAERELQAALQREVNHRERTQAFVQRLIDVIPQPVYVKDIHSRFVMINEAFTRERMLPAEQIIGKAPSDLTRNSAHIQKVLDEDRAVLAGAVILKEELGSHAITGEDRFRLISKRVSQDAAGETVIIGANFDITPWRSAERDLQNALANQSRLHGFLQSLFDALPSPLFVEDSEGLLLMANRALAELFACDKESLIGSRLEQLGGGCLAQKPAGTQPEAGKIHENELEHKHATGRSTHFIMRDVLSPGLDSRPVRIGILTDISSLRAAEARWLKAKEAAEQASAAKSIFLASMSHEIRTPLNGVIGTLRLALRENELQGLCRQYVETSLASAETLLAIINDILDFSKIEAGELKIEEIDLDLAALLRESMSALENNARHKGLDFQLRIDPLLPTYIRSDPTRIRQVLTNLVGNACKFTERGQVTVAVGLADQRICCSIQDSGIGIAAAALPKLFQRFQQADTTTTRRYGGTGLGLAICRQLVEAMGGEISAESQLGQGSIFRFWLPLKMGQMPVKPQDRLQEKHARQLRILCAEDVAVNQLIIKALLQKMGHQVALVENGLEAIKALSEQDYDLVLMDGRMPEMDGKEATRAIRAGGLPDHPVRQANIHVIALTADASMGDQQEYLDAGMDAFLTKPINEQQLHAAIRHAIEQNSPEAGSA